MALNYINSDYKIAQGETEIGDGCNWTPYSYLFMGLSVIFLLFYLLISLGSGINSKQLQVPYQELSMDTQDFSNQSLTNERNRLNYMKSQIYPKSKNLYEALLNKFILLNKESKKNH